MGATRHWVIGLLLLVLTVFAGSTFQTLWVLIGGYAAAASMVLARGRIGRGARVKSPPAAETDPGRGPGGERPTVRLLRRGALTTLFAAASTLVAAWRMDWNAPGLVDALLAASDTLAHVAVVDSWIVWVVCFPHGHVALLPLGMMVALLTVEGGGASQSVVGQMAVGLVACAAYAVASQAIFSRRRSRSSDPQTTTATSNPAPLWFSGVALTAMLICTTLLTQATNRVLPDLREKTAERLSDSLERVSGGPRVTAKRYVTGSKLGMIRSHILHDSNVVALRGYSDSPPGYLRGSVYDRYSRHRWMQVDGGGAPISRSATISRRLKPDSPGRTPIEGRITNRLTRFQLTPRGTESTVAVELHGIPHRGRMVFSPLGARWIEADANGVALSRDEIVVAGVDIAEPYVFGVSRTVPPRSLEPGRRRQLLEVGTDIRKTLERFASEWCGEAATPRAKADAVSRRFQNEFRYSLGDHDFPARVDPIVHFLNTGHSAHCEYFATATALILRAAGVPTRYVTGYVMDEASDEEPYWLARNHDAHAWVEAYDDRSRRWFPVESTPGRNYVTLSLEADQDRDDVAENAAAAGGLTDTDPWYVRLWNGGASARLSATVTTVLRIAQLPLICSLVLMLWVRFGRRSTVGDEAGDARSLRMLRRVDRRLRRRSLQREPHETLHQFASRIERRLADEPESASEPYLRRAAAWYRDYAEARYRGREPRPLA